MMLTVSGSLSIGKPQRTAPVVGEGKEWFHNGLRCFVLLNHGGFPCGYVEIPSWSVLKYESLSKLYDMFDDAAYLGITYTGSRLPNRYCRKGCFYIGFDMMHGCDVEYDRETFEMRPLRTVEDCVEHVNVLADAVAVQVHDNYGKLDSWYGMEG